MQRPYTLWSRLQALLSFETHHRFRCFRCDRETLVADRSLEDARRNGCGECAGTLIPHEQSMGICCPTCPAELVSTGEVTRKDPNDMAIVAYECQFCGQESVWHLGAIPGALQLDRDPEDLEDVEII